MNEQEHLTSAMEDYLEAIYVLASDAPAVRLGAIAKQVGVHKSTATAALKVLAQQDLVEYAPYRPVLLKPRGKRIGARIRQRHETLQRFLVEVLGIDPEEAEETACKMEHVIPPHIIARFTAFADYVDRCPNAGARFAKDHGYFCDAVRNGDICGQCPAEVPEAPAHPAPPEGGVP